MCICLPLAEALGSEAAEVDRMIDATADSAQLSIDRRHLDTAADGAQAARRLRPFRAADLADSSHRSLLHERLRIESVIVGHVSNRRAQRATPKHIDPRKRFGEPCRIERTRTFRTSATLAAVYAGSVAFTLPDDLIFNTQKLAAPAEFARDHDAASWLYLNGEEFASMEGGMSYAQVQQAVPRSINVVTDPPRVLDLELARQHCAALDELPRPTLITCRAGPRASAVSYMYAGLRAGAEPAEVLAAAERAGAPFCKFDDYKEWVATSITTLRTERR